ncbi:MAG TPA: hypothetical protein DEB31_03195 [Clostridiales bacterium]|nr:hypothetical protein [Clostridiales bacterium]
MWRYNAITDSVPDTQFAPELNVGSIVLVIVFLAAILIGAYYLTKFVGKRALQKGMKQKPAGAGRWRSHEPGRLISIADRIAIDREKTVMVVEFKGKYYLLSTTPKEIHCIDSIPVPPEDIEEPDMEEPDSEERAAVQVVTFRSVMGNVGTEIKNRTYAFFHRGKLPPQKQSFENQLQREIEEQEAGKDTKKK